VVLPPGAEPGTPLPGPGAFQQFLPFMGAP
jgi:hypothetical protein